MHHAYAPVATTNELLRLQNWNFLPLNRLVTISHQTIAVVVADNCPRRVNNDHVDDILIIKLEKSSMCPEKGPFTTTFLNASSRWIDKCRSLLWVFCTNLIHSARLSVYYHQTLDASQSSVVKEIRGFSVCIGSNRHSSTLHGVVAGLAYQHNSVSGHHSRMSISISISGRGPGQENMPRIYDYCAPLL